MGIMQRELNDLRPRMKVTKASWQEGFLRRKKTAVTGLEKMVANDPILSLFEFYNDNHAVASASIGQVGTVDTRMVSIQLATSVSRERTVY